MYCMYFKIFKAEQNFVICKILYQNIYTIIIHRVVFTRTLLLIFEQF